MHLVHLPNAFDNAPGNMALDSTLLQTVPQAHALFRHYGWIEPALTYGYTQRFREVHASAPEDIHLCRRPTAGGIVDHRNDWTYSLVLHAALPAAKLPPAKLYTAIHQCLQHSLRKQGIHSRLAPCPRQCAGTATPAPADRSRCFANPVADDLLHTGNDAKIAGAAIKRSRHGLLLQGSIDRAALPPGFQPAPFADQFARAIADAFSLTTRQLPDLRPLFQQPLLDDLRKRYASSQWQEKR
ncbi:MAG: lipoyl protein ligase domain-containing protein [Coraliomargarita sp.]